MFPSREVALEELKIAGNMNPGPWVQHSLHVAAAAEQIARSCSLDANKAYVCGALHDIGRRTGIAAMRHIIDGYDYTMTHHWDEVARVCLTHSFPIRDIETDIGRKDVTPDQYRFIQDFLSHTVYDEYDKLIILCDALADANGFCPLEKRFIDVTRRYGIFPFTIDRWNMTYEYKKEFEQIIGTSLYTLLPGIEQSLYE